MSTRLPSGSVVLVAPTSRGRPTTRCRIEKWEDRRAAYIGVELGLTRAERQAGGIPPVRIFRPHRILAVRVREGFQTILPGVLL